MGKIPTLDINRIITKDHLPEFDDIRFGAMLLVDKPIEWTSFDVVNKIRSSLKYGPEIKKIKVGHAGTLDPLATGLLLVCIGKYTKRIDTLTIKDKAYSAEVKLGAVTKTYDREAPEESITDIGHLTLQSITEVCNTFIGEQEQMPPIYSAIKIDGKTAHRLARKGKEVKMKPRAINIPELKITDWKSPFIKLDVSCSKGTYIRSLAYDIGTDLGVGGYLSGLVRTSIGHYKLSNALTIQESINWIDRLPKTQKELASH